MSWLFSRALVEEYSAANCLDGEQSAPLNGSPTQQAYCAPDKMTAFSRLSRFGMTFKPLTADRGQELLMSYLEDFRARTLAQQEKAQALTESAAECGEKWHGSFTKYSPATSSWKTHQCSLLGDLDEFSETWPQWGLMRGGECWEQQTLVRPINEIASGLPDGETFFHTPNTTGLDGGSNSRKALKKRIENWPTPTASMMPCEGTQRIMRKKWLAGELSLEEASAVAGRDVRKAQGKVPMITPAARDGNPTNTLETLMDGRFVDQLANRVKMVENNLWTTPCSRDWKGKTISKNHPEGFNKSLANDVLKFPTPQASDCRDRGNMSNPAIQRRAENGKQLNLSMVVHPTSGQLNPTWVEWLMGWPLGWTDLKPLETDKCPSVPQQHGDC
jgi:DNA (cytosine-5)-methyltransferase 1